MKNPLALHGVLHRFPGMLGIHQEEFLNQGPTSWRTEIVAADLQALLPKGLQIPVQT